LNRKSYLELINPRLFFYGLVILGKLDKPAGSRDGSIMGDLLWPIRESINEENLDLIGEAMLDGYFYSFLKLPYPEDRDVLILNQEARIIVKQLVYLTDKMCRNSKLNIKEIERVERPYNWYLRDFLSRAKDTDWVNLVNTEGEVYFIPSESYCRGFSESGIRELFEEDF